MKLDNWLTAAIFSNKNNKTHEFWPIRIDECQKGPKSSLLVQSNLKAEQANEAKSYGLLAILSHEIRYPMNGHSMGMLDLVAQFRALNRTKRPTE